MPDRTDRADRADGAESTDRWHRADAIFEAALDLPPEERSGHVLVACGDDGELRALVERLLANAETAAMDLEPGGGLQGPLLQGLARELDEEIRNQEVRDESAAVGQVVGRYRLLREVGRGGMAVVFLAERADGQFQQEVALKLIQEGILTDEARRRFDQERQILALAQHPNIARLLDGGVDAAGRPYFAMEHVCGRPIDRYADEEELSVNERLELFLQVARAVEYAHRSLVVHRDIKPSNILVDAEGQVKLLDFGIAKLLDADAAAPVTRSDARVMTPVYASPEQIRGGQITTASDVYQLGLLLYELLTGRGPYHLKDAGPVELARAICEEEPTRPSTAIRRTAEGPAGPGGSTARLRRELSGDLDNVILMALRKEPERRYGSVERLRDDIERYLEDRPVRARPDTFTYRAGKFLRRHRAPVVTAAAAAFLIVALALFYTLRLAEERDRARLAAVEATQVSDFLRELFEVSAPTRSRGEEITARQLLDRGARRIEAELEGQPEVQANLMTLMGDVYRQLALYPEARPLLEEALVLRQETSEESRLRLAETLQAFARLEEAEGQLDSALALYDEALLLRETELGGEHPDVAASLDGRGRIRALLGEHEAAIADQERALGILEASLGATAPEVGLVLRDLGESLEAAREHALSRARLERAVAILGAAFEPDHPHIAEARVILAEALRFTGESARAREQYELALPVIETVYGPDHPEVAEVLHKLGNLLVALEDLPAALPRLERALAIREAALGTEHPRVGANHNDLGLALKQAKDFPAAQASFERALAVLEATLGRSHPHVAIALYNLAEVRRLLGARDAALVELYERVLTIRGATFGPSHSQLVRPLMRLGRLRLESGDSEAAVAFFRRALAAGRDAAPFRQIEQIWPRLELARCLLALDRGNEAEALLLENLAEEDIARGFLHDTHEILAELYTLRGEHEKAARHREVGAVEKASE